MNGPAAYGARWADVYDERNPIDDFAESVADILSEVADGRPALEFGVGTGRVAIPLAKRGVQVHGVDVSPGMLDRLRARPGGEAVQVTLGDMTCDRFDGRFGVVYLVFNTLFMIPEQAGQVRCLRNAASHLGPDGVLVIEAFVPEPLPPGGQPLRAERICDDEVWLLASRHDPIGQLIVTQSIRLEAARIELRPVTLRYIWPSELDLMCQIAGLDLVGRYGDWHRRPFDSQSTHHISMYRVHADGGRGHHV